MASLNTVQAAMWDRLRPGIVALIAKDGYAEHSGNILSAITKWAADPDSTFSTTKFRNQLRKIVPNMTTDDNKKYAVLASTLRDARNESPARLRASNTKVTVSETMRKRNYNMAMVERTQWRRTGPRAMDAGIISQEQAAQIDDMLTVEIQRWSAVSRKNPFKA